MPEQPVKQIGDVFQEQRPGGSVDRMGFAEGVRQDGRGQQEQAEGEDQHQLLGRNRDAHRLRRADVGIEHEAKEPRHRGDRHDRMQPDQTALDEAPGGKCQLRFGVAPKPVVIGVAHDKAGKGEKEVHRQIGMVQGIVRPVGRHPFEDVEQHDAEGRGAAQPVQNLIMCLHISSKPGSGFGRRKSLAVPQR